MRTKKFTYSTILVLVAMLLVLAPASAQAPSYPEIVSLPDGFRPEGIAVGRGSTFFTGSLANGAVYRGDLRTGEGSILVPGQAGMISVGMFFDERSNALFVAGGATGMARVFDADSGALLSAYQLAPQGNFINDVVVTREAAYFTNSSQSFFYRLPLGPRGSLPAASDVQAIPLSGDWTQVPGFNSNGIEATPDGKWLVIVNSTVGKLFRVDPASGAAREINLGGESVTMGDGLRFRGSLLYVVRNRINQVVVVDPSADLTSGVVIDRLTNPNFNVPTTLGAFGNALYAVNAKFGLPSPNTLPFEIVRVELN